MKPLYLDWNLGLGDAIICNGLVRYLAQRKPGQMAREMILPCWSHNRPTVSHMFSDLPNVRITSPENGDGPVPEPVGYEVMSIGIHYPRWGAVEPWDKAFYEFAGVPFDAKWDLFHVPESPTEIRCIFEGPFILLHDCETRGFSIDPARLPREPAIARIAQVTEAPLLTDWRELIYKATEIHCIDSSVMHLVELLPTRPLGKLVYHKYARAANSRNPVDAVFRKEWKIIE